MNDSNGTPWIIGVVLVLAIGAGGAAIFLMDTRGEKGDGLSDEFQYDITSLKATDPVGLIVNGASSNRFHSPRFTSLRLASTSAPAAESRLLTSAGLSL